MTLILHLIYYMPNESNFQLNLLFLFIIEDSKRIELNSSLHSNMHWMSDFISNNMHLFIGIKMLSSLNLGLAFDLLMDIF